MSKTLKGIIGLTALLAVLGGGYAALRLTEPKDDPDSSSSGAEMTTSALSETVILIKDDAVTGTDPETGETLEGVIKTVDVTNQTDVLHVVQKSTKTEESAATYTLDGYQDIKMNDSVIGTLANNANGLTSESTIEKDCTDLAKFGLEEPAITVKVTYETGTEVTLLIGDPAPAGDAVYCRLDGSNDVYTVRSSALANYSKPLNEFVDKTLLEAPDQDNYPIVDSLRIERDDIDYDIFIKYDDRHDDENYTGGTSATHVMVEPTDAFLSVERSTDIITGMFGLSATDIYSLHCEESDIAGAGLKEPFCKVTMDCRDADDHVLLISEPFTDSVNGKCCYAMLKGEKVIFTIAYDKLPWASVMPVDIASKIFIADYVWSLTDMDIKVRDGEEQKFTIAPIDPESEVNSRKSADMKVTLNGEEYDSERFRLFYSFLVGANAEELILEEKVFDTEPAVTITYSESYDDEQREIKIYDASNFRSIIVINGIPKFYISKSYVDTLIDNIGKFNTDEDFVTTWK